jgi:hypothetical protein
MGGGVQVVGRVGIRDGWWVREFQNGRERGLFPILAGVVVLGQVSCFDGVVGGEGVWPLTCSIGGQS